MKLPLFLILCFFFSSLFAQVSIKGPWTAELGASSPNAFTRSSSFNLRYISPRFRWSDDLLSDEEEKMEQFKNMRLMIEVIYTPPFKVFCAGFNAQYRIINYKRFSGEIYGGYKVFLVTGSDFSRPSQRQRLLRGDVWYMNMGLLMQFNLGVIAPFADLGGDRIITIGTEVNLHSVYRKPKRRYNLHTGSVPRKT